MCVTSPLSASSPASVTSPASVGRTHRRGAVRGWIALLAVLVLTVPAAPAVPAAADPTTPVGALPGTWSAPRQGVAYELPVPGDLRRSFDPPRTALGEGHRGVDLAVPVGAPIRAAAAGRIVFAGPVAGAVWVSIAHPDGVVTSYGPLARLRVRTGDEVARATRIGVLADGGHGEGGRDDGLHWGARVDRRYLDPLILLDIGIPRPSLVGAGSWHATAHAVVPYASWSGGRVGGLLTSPSPVAERAGYAVAPNPNHLVLVPGLASTSDTVVLEYDHLGYDPRSVTRFSYAGRHEGRGDPGDPLRDQVPYTAADTWAGSGPAAEALAEQLRAQAAREPGRPVDLIGHSMGGVVILRYLVEHHDAYDRTLPPLGHVVTIASPLDGSDLASIGRTARAAPLVGEAIRLLQDRGELGGDWLPLDAPAVEELAVGSRALWDLAVGWERALHAGTAGPLATGTRVLNIGGSRDLVVSSDRTRQPDTLNHAGVPADLGLGAGADGLAAVPPGFLTRNGATATIDGQRVVDHRVLPGGHTSVLGTEAIREVTWRFLAGEEVVDAPGHVSRVIGGELADSARIGAELFSAYGPLARALRSGDRAIPVEPP